MQKLNGLLFLVSNTILKQKLTNIGAILWWLSGRREKKVCHFQTHACNDVHGRVSFILGREITHIDLQ